MAGLKLAEKLSLSISCAAFALSGVTAWFQFGPTHDSIIIAKNSRSYFNEYAKISNDGVPLYGDFQKYSNISPVSWDIILYNPGGRSESIVGARVFVDAGKGRSESSRMLQNFVPQPLRSGEAGLPFEISAYSSRNFHVSLEIPIEAPDHSIHCPTQGQISEIEKCFQENGRDIIGNIVFRRDLGAGNFAVSWPDRVLNPNFILVLQTADGSKFEVPLEVFPFRELGEEK